MCTDHAASGSTRRGQERRRPRQLLPPGAADDEREEDERDEHGVPGAREREDGDAEPDERERRPGGPESRPRDEVRPARERGREHGLARDLVEHDPVRRVHEQRHSRRDRDTRPERPRGRRPGDDRAREEHRHGGLRERAACEIEQGAVHDRRQRRAEEHRPRRHRVGVEELPVREQVLVEVSADLERPGDGAHREDGKADGEENDGAERAGGEPLERCEGPGGPFLHRCHAPKPRPGGGGEAYAERPVVGGLGRLRSTR